MALPELIPIAWEENGRTDTIGRFADGQFIIRITAGQEGDPEDGLLGLHGATELFAYLHIFGHDGRHQSSDIRRLSDQHYLTPAEEDAADETILAWLEDLDDAEFGDIAVRPFRAEFERAVFGLIACVDLDDDESTAVGLYPDDLWFGSRWDGTYCT